MRMLLLIPLVLIFGAIGGWMLCTVGGWDPHPREMLAAAVVALVASSFAALVLVKVRSKTQPAVAQGALVAISLHMLAALAMSALVWLVGIALRTPFALWLLTFYWLTLAVLARGFVQVIKAAPMEAARN